MATGPVRPLFSALVHPSAAFLASLSSTQPTLPREANQSDHATSLLKTIKYFPITFSIESKLLSPTRALPEGPAFPFQPHLLQQPTKWPSRCSALRPVHSSGKTSGVSISLHALPSGRKTISFFSLIPQVSLRRHLLQKPPLTTGFGQVPLSRPPWQPVLTSFPALTTHPGLSPPALPFPWDNKQLPILSSFLSPGPRTVPVALDKCLWTNNDRRITCTKHLLRT